MSSKPNLPKIFKPTLIIHGGAGNMSRKTLPPNVWASYRASLEKYTSSTAAMLQNGATALDAAVHAVTLLENDPLFNCGHGAVFTARGTQELEASLMVSSVRGESHDVLSHGGRKRGAGVMLLSHVKNPIKLAREALLRTGDNHDGGSMHAQLSGDYAEELASEWGLEIMPTEYFFTQKRWDEHLRGLKGETESIYLSQGTVGCVCLDQYGDLCTATSTGGLTNKAVGRIGDTPTLGAGFWAESWDVDSDALTNTLGGKELEKTQQSSSMEMSYAPPPPYSPINNDSDADTNSAPDTLLSSLTSCLGLTPTPSISTPKSTIYTLPPSPHPSPSNLKPQSSKSRHALALSGTGNGDSFLRTSAARTTSALVRFRTPSPSLSAAVTAVAGPDGELQRSAGKNWGVTGEGQGGIIGIEACWDAEGNGESLGEGKVVEDFNCGGMFRGWVEGGLEHGEVKTMVFREEYP